jgi:biotin carboxyl carrier protein
VAVLVVGLALILTAALWRGDAEEPGPAAAAAAAPMASEPDRDPTPRFARIGTMEMRLPVDPSDMTALAFHQASGDSALPITSLVPDADMELAAELQAVPPAGETADVPDDVLGSVCLRLWRSNRTGMPDTAADVGADAGTDVYSPVSGTVVEVRPYLLYDVYEDYEIHIQPDGRSDVDVVLIHVDDVTVRAGDTVAAGVTRIAAVRLMSDKIEIQLGGYTENGGDHVHIQVNEIGAPGELDAAGES